MRTYLKRLGPLTVSLLASVASGDVVVQDHVIIQRTGSSYVYIFPTTQGRIVGVKNPAGRIDIGRTITVMYALNIIKSGKARFIGVNPSEKMSGSFDAKLSVQQSYETFGFFVKDLNQPELPVHINAGLMAATKKKIQEKIAQQGNLQVIIAAEKNGRLKVYEVIVD